MKDKGEEKKKKRQVFKRKDYLNLVADRLVSTRPTREITNNTLFDVYSTGVTDGYIQRIDDASRFKQLREKHRVDSWNKVKEHWDDIIHNRDVTKKHRTNKKKK